jgi:hypothetical protein
MVGEFFSLVLPLSLSLKSVSFPACHNLSLLDVHPLSSSLTSGLISIGLYEAAVASHHTLFCVRLSLVCISRVVMLDLRFSWQRLQRVLSSGI